MAEGNGVFRVVTAMRESRRFVVESRGEERTIRVSRWVFGAAENGDRMLAKVARQERRAQAARRREEVR